MIHPVLFENLILSSFDQQKPDFISQNYNNFYILPNYFCKVLTEQSACTLTRKR